MKIMTFSRYYWRLNALTVLASLCIALIVGQPASTASAQILSPPPKRLTPEMSQPIRQLLTEDWPRNPKIEERSKRTLANAGTFTDDLLVSFLINRIRHNRIDDAKLIARELTVRHPDNLDGWLFKTWLNTLTDDYDAALVDMRSLKKKVDSLKKVPQSTQQHIYKRLGSMIGYLQGPVGDRVNDDLLDETIKIVANGIKPDLMKLFNEKRNKVLKTYGDLTKTQADKTQKELVKVKVANDAEVVALEREVQLLEKTESQLIPEKQTVRDDASRQISTIERQGSSIEIQLNRINADLRATEFDLILLYQNLNVILRQAPQFRVSTLNIRNQIRNAELTISSLRTEGIQATNQLNTLQSQLNVARRNTNQRINELDREIRRVNGAKRRNIAKIAKLAKGPKLADGKRDALRSRARALRTYDKLSLELYRQDILDQLSK